MEQAGPVPQDNLPGTRRPQATLVSLPEFAWLAFGPCAARENEMTGKVKENMEVIGADGVHVGTVDRIEDNRIKLKKSDGFGRHEGHHHYVEMGFVAGVEGDKVRLSANADVAVTLEEEASGRPVKLG
jgi:hypothetical protein